MRWPLKFHWNIAELHWLSHTRIRLWKVDPAHLTVKTNIMILPLVHHLFRSTFLSALRSGRTNEMKVQNTFSVRVPSLLLSSYLHKSIGTSREFSTRAWQHQTHICCFEVIISDTLVKSTDSKAIENDLWNCKSKFRNSNFWRKVDWHNWNRSVSIEHWAEKLNAWNEKIILQQSFSACQRTSFKLVFISAS